MLSRTEMPSRYRMTNFLPNPCAAFGRMCWRRFNPSYGSGLLFESSDRLDPVVEYHIGGNRVVADGVELKAHHGLADKRKKWEELEVADFLSIVAGRPAHRLAFVMGDSVETLRSPFRRTPNVAYVLCVGLLATLNC